MVAVLKPLALIGSFASLSCGWSLGINTVSTCGNPGGVDSSRGGVAGVTADCMIFNSFEEVQSLEIKDWDEGCVFNTYSGPIGDLCVPDEMIGTYSLDSDWPMQDGYYCISQQHIPGDFSFQYVCGG
jgi:hypothetical protein